MRLNLSAISVSPLYLKVQLHRPSDLMPGSLVPFGVEDWSPAFHERCGSQPSAAVISAGSSLGCLILKIISKRFLLISLASSRPRSSARTRWPPGGCYNLPQGHGCSSHHLGCAPRRSHSDQYRRDRSGLSPGTALSSGDLLTIPSDRSAWYRSLRHSRPRTKSPIACTRCVRSARSRSKPGSRCNVR